MKTTIIINPQYSFLESFINDVPNIFIEQGATIYDSRNVIKVFDIDGIQINVKRYHAPKGLNKLIYSFFRTSKGLRAYQYPTTLLKEGIETPQPIAYIEFRKYGLIDYSYFISKHCTYKHRLYEIGNASKGTYEELAVALAQNTAKMHEAQILHKDYSPGNILFEKINGEYKFSVVDINRMYFGPVNKEKGCANFARLWGPKDFFIILAKEYARIRHFDENECIRLVLFYRARFWKRYGRKHEIEFKLEL